MSNYGIPVNQSATINNIIGSTIIRWDDGCHTWAPIYTQPQIKKVIFNPPATIILWQDGTKTVVKASEEEFCEEKGFSMAYLKKVFGGRNQYLKHIKNAERKYIKQDNEKVNKSKFNIEDIMNKKIAINCKTEELAKEFLKGLHEDGITWTTGTSLLKRDNWKIHNYGTCYCLRFPVLGFNSSCFYEDEGYKIVEFDGWDNFTI